MGSLARKVQVDRTLELTLQTSQEVGQSPRRRKAFIVGGSAGTMIRFRGALIKELAKRGYEVVCASSPTDAESERKLLELGARYVPIPLARGGVNPLRDLHTLWALLKILVRERPDVVMTYNMKPTVYGTLAAWMARVRRRVAMVEGLGYAYTPGREWKRRIARIASDILYRIPCTLADTIIVLNRDDREFFEARLMRRKKDRIQLVRGIGVELDEYRPSPLPRGPLTFVMIGRLLRDKGVVVFADAARQLKSQNLDARFLLVGGTDDNPTSVSCREVEEWVREGVLDYAGEVRDVRPFLRDSHVLVLPTHYREGVPRTIMEAMAMGRPCIATDVPGCSDAVKDGKTGILIKPQSVESLVKAMKRLHGDRSVLSRMATNAASAARQAFDCRELARQTSQILSPA